MKLKIRFRKMALAEKLKWLRMVIIVPMTLGILSLLIIMINFNEEYNETVKNVSQASKFNFSFAEDIDYKMYRIVIGAESFESMKPYEEIRKAKSVVEDLRNNAVTEESRQRTKQICKLLDNLKASIQEIEKADIQDDYMENNQKLQLNVNVFTEIIKDKMSEYIYYETGNMERLRIQKEKEIMQTISITILLLAVMISLVWKLTQMISKSISQPIHQLCDMTKEVAAGNFQVSGPENTTEEIQILTENFEQMVKKISCLLENVKTEQNNLRKKELQLLQEQINPHFLYNTLDTIVWLSVDGQNDKVVQMVTALSAFFRTSLSQGENMIKIKDELKHVRSYLEIQQLRYEDIMEFSIDVPEDIQKYYILKITLQPLVENALYHGLKMQRTKGRIKIAAVDDEDHVYLTVEDTGIGMSPEQVESLNLEMQKDHWENRTSGFGIVNVNQRIKLHFGNDYGLIFESEPGSGTKVIIVVPKRI